MERLAFYALCDNETNLLSNVITAYDDAAAARFIISTLKSVYDDLEVADLKKNFADKIHHYSIVKIGSLDLIEHDLQNDYVVLATLFDLFSENEVKE